MNRIAKALFRKPTLFFVIGLVALLVGLPAGIYYSTLQGLEGLGAAYAFLGALIGLLLLLMDRAALQVASQKRLNLLELALLLIAVVAYAYNTRKVFVDIGPAAYFVLIENNGHFRNSEMKRVFPFHRRLISEGQGAVINSLAEPGGTISVEYPADWQGYLMRARTLEQTTVLFYHKYGTDWADHEADSLARTVLANQSQD